MNETDKILYKMGYFDADPLKRQAVQDAIAAAVEYMREAGVPDDKLSSQRAFSVKALWADAEDKGTLDAALKPDGMIVALIAQMRR